MSLTLKYCKHVLKFKFDAGTSRGVLKTKDSWMIKLYDADNPGVYGLGEVSIIERLSFDHSVDFDLELEYLAKQLKKEPVPSSPEDVYPLVKRVVELNRPSIRFALETALFDLINGGKRLVFHNTFSTQEVGIPINGLVWMGDEDFMQNQIGEKLKAGFKCIKMKIAALDFETEYKLLKRIRKKHGKEKLILRVDANGGFLTQEVLKKLDTLADLDLHSIEQPIMPHQLQAMQLVCKRSKVPVALDEELIAVFGLNEKRELLRTIQPQYIVLKPSLLGGFKATREWIDLAEEMNIGWWITSALESNIGLNAICQFTAEFDYVGHQGLGTGQLYENNIHSPLIIQGEEIIYRQDLSWDEPVFD